MAKPKAKTGRGRPAVEAKDKSFRTLGCRVSEPYLQWITQTASVNRSSVSDLIDRAVAKYARDIDVTVPPPDRTA